MIILTDFHFEPDKKKEYANELLDKIDILAKKLNIKDELSLCNLYAYLLYKGKLSLYKVFNYHTEDIKDNGFYNLMLGYGCCRNIASGLKQVLDKANVKNCVLATAPLYKMKSDHVVNLIITDEGYFIYDITNMLFMKVTGKLLTSINYKMTPTKITNIKTTFNGRTRDIYCKNDKIFDPTSTLKECKSLRYTKEEYLERYEKDISFFKENEDLFQEFYVDAFENIKGITNSL